MSAETALLDRLRSPRWSAFHGMDESLCLEAAAEIERLRVALVQARGAPPTTCPHCNRPADTVVCGVGGCPVGGDL